MISNIRKLVFSNLTAKLLALFFALTAWTLICIKEKTYSDRALRIPVEFTHIPDQIEVVSAKPEAVQVTIQGSSRTFHDFNPNTLRIRIDLKEIDSSGRLTFFAEDYLDIPSHIKIISLHPKMIEVNVERLAYKEVTVHARFRNRLPAGLRMTDAVVSPDKVTIYGYEDRVAGIYSVDTEEIDLTEITATATVKVGLIKPSQALNIMDIQKVDVRLKIEKISGSRP